MNENLEARFADLEAKIDKSAKETKLWKISAFVLLLIALALFLQMRVTSVEAQDTGQHQIVLTDKNGKPRIVMGVENDEPFFGMFDAKGKLRTGIVISSDGSANFTMTDPKEINKVVMGVAKDGTPVMGMNDNKGRTRAAMTLDTSDNPGMFIFDAAGKVIWSALK